MNFDNYYRLDRKSASDKLKEMYDCVLTCRKPFAGWPSVPENQLNTGQFKTNDAMWQYWEDHAKEHLPLALKVIERDDLDYGLFDERTPTTGESELRNRQKVVLFVVGYSPEQLALSIAMHILNGCHVFVPVSGKAWESKSKDSLTVRETVIEHLTDHLFFEAEDDISDEQPNLRQFRFIEREPIEDEHARP